jgi:hypothetical protein
MHCVLLRPLLTHCCSVQAAAVAVFSAAAIAVLLSQGYLIGNGVTDDVFDGNAYLPFAAGKSLISELQLKRAAEACQGNFWDWKSGSRCAPLLEKGSGCRG